MLVKTPREALWLLSCPLWFIYSGDGETFRGVNDTNIPLWGACVGLSPLVDHGFPGNHDLLVSIHLSGAGLAGGQEAELGRRV